VLGATGSIGVNTLDVVSRHPDRYEVLALSAQNKVDRLAEQCVRFRPRYAVVGSDEAAASLERTVAPVRYRHKLFLAGIEALERICQGLPEG
jgi:1-deoxy-D-xylulose 5-phosphate reductoisomerase (EC 1.1.1.267)